MTICSPSTGYIALGLRPRAILPASGEQIVMSPSLKGNNCIISQKYMYPKIFFSEALGQSKPNFTWSILRIGAVPEHFVEEELKDLKRYK